MDDYSQYLTFKNYAPRTIQEAVKTVGYLQNWYEEDLAYLTYENLSDYLKTLAHLKPQTINQRLMEIRRYFDYLIETNQTNYNPARGVKVRNEETPSFKLLSPEELDEIYSRYKTDFQNYKILLGFVVYQAAEAGTLKQLEKGDVDLDKGIIQLRGTRRYNSRKLSLHASQLLPLYKYLPALEDAEKVFTATRMSRLFDRSLVELKKQFPKIENYRQIRKSVITNWLKVYNLREVQYYCGHRYISSTEAYKIVDLESMKEALSDYHPLG